MQPTEQEASGVFPEESQGIADIYYPDQFCSHTYMEACKDLVPEPEKQGATERANSVGR